VPQPTRPAASRCAGAAGARRARRPAAPGRLHRRRRRPARRHHRDAGFAPPATTSPTRRYWRPGRRRRWRRSRPSPRPRCAPAPSARAWRPSCRAPWPTWTRWSPRPLHPDGVAGALPAGQLGPRPARGRAGRLQCLGRRRHTPVRVVAKGSYPWSEHYSALQAEVPDAADPGTQLNQALLQRLDAGRRAAGRRPGQQPLRAATVEHLVRAPARGARAAGAADRRHEPGGRLRGPAADFLAARSRGRAGAAGRSRTGARHRLARPGRSGGVRHGERPLQVEGSRGLSRRWPRCGHARGAGSRLRRHRRTRKRAARASARSMAVAPVARHRGHHHQAGSVGGQLDLATLVHAAARAVDVGQLHRGMRHQPGQAAERKTDAALARSLIAAACGSRALKTTCIAGLLK
jgi:hypothetical protein